MRDGGGKEGGMEGGEREARKERREGREKKDVGERERRGCT